MEDRPVLLFHDASVASMIACALRHDGCTGDRHRLGAQHRTRAVKWMTPPGKGSASSLSSYSATGTGVFRSCCSQK